MYSLRAYIFVHDHNILSYICIFVDDAVPVNNRVNHFQMLIL